MEIIGYAGSLVMGVVLGLIGGGGSLLTIPILIYLFGMTVGNASAYSLFVVGLTSVVGAAEHVRRGQVHLSVAAVFGIPSVLAVFLVRSVCLPMIPEHIASVGPCTFTKSTGIMVGFGLLMLVSAISMLRPKTNNVQATGTLWQRHVSLAVKGLIVGILTGMVGAGGGFLIVPALVVLSGLSMKEAVGTSLLIISVKSLVGFLGDLSVGLAVNLPFLLTFSSFAIAGILIGNYLLRHVSNEHLKPAFAYFMCLMASVILVRQLMF